MKKILLFLCAAALLVIPTACNADPTPTVSTPDGPIKGAPTQANVFMLDWLQAEMKGLTVTDVAFYDEEILLVAFTNGNGQAGFTAFDIEAGVQAYKQEVPYAHRPVLRVWEDGSVSMLAEQGDHLDGLFFRNPFDKNPLPLAAVSDASRVFVNKTKYYTLSQNVISVGTIITDEHKKLLDISEQYQDSSIVYGIDGSLRLLATNLADNQLAEVLITESTAAQQVACPVTKEQYVGVLNASSYIRRVDSHTLGIRHGDQEEILRTQSNGANTPMAVGADYFITNSDAVRVFKMGINASLLTIKPLTVIRRAAVSPQQTMAMLLCTDTKDGPVVYLANLAALTK